MRITWSPLAVQRVLEAAEFIALDKSEAAAHWAHDGTTKGEFTLVIEGAEPREPSMPDAVAAALEMITRGTSTSDAVRTVTATHGVRRNELYDLVVKARS